MSGTLLPLIRATDLCGDHVLCASRVLVDASTVLENTGIEVRGGRVAAVHEGRAVARRVAERAGLPFVELAGTLIPGLVCAHAHLDLSGLAGRVPAGEDFVSWLEALIPSRAERLESEDLLEADVQLGAQRLFASGVVLVGDVDSSGGSARVLAGTTLFSRSYRELLNGANPVLPETVRAAITEQLNCQVDVGDEALCRGFSPHAPYTVSDGLLDTVAELAPDAWLQVHWNETLEELEWLREAGGPFRRLLKHRPEAGSLARLAQRGLLTERTCLVHANYPSTSDVEVIANSGATIVHCPGAHKFFNREAFPLADFRAAGVRVAIGTDSLAGNEDLDLLREMALLREEFPWLEAAEVLRAATEVGASVLGFGTRLGSLRPGMQACWALFPSAASAEDDFEAITRAAVRPLAVQGRVLSAF